MTAASVQIHSLRDSVTPDRADAILDPHDEPTTFASTGRIDTPAAEFDVLVPVAVAAGSRIGCHNHHAESPRDVAGKRA